MTAKPTLSALAILIAAVAATSSACAQPAPASYVPPPFASSGNPAFDAWRTDFAARAVNQHGKPRQIVESVLTGLTPDLEVKRLNEAQPEFVRPIWAYLASAVSANRVAEGRQRLAEVSAGIGPVAARMGVPVEVAVAIWGIESSFGAIRGSSDVPRSLATLAYTGRRTQLGETELLAVFDILSRGEAQRASLVGSWAGAMGHTQFMPSSFLSRAIDGDGDGRRDIWTNRIDGLASTINYLRDAGWKAGEPWGQEVRAPDRFDWSLAGGSARPVSEWTAMGVVPSSGVARFAPDAMARVIAPAGSRGAVFLVGANFDAIRNYNAADAYALAVAYLSDAIAGAGGLPTRWPTDDPPLNRTDARMLQGLLLAMGFDVGNPDGQAGPRTRRALQAFQTREGQTADGYPSSSALAAVRAAAARQGVTWTPPPPAAASPPVPASAPATGQPQPSPSVAPPAQPTQSGSSSAVPAMRPRAETPLRAPPGSPAGAQMLPPGVPVRMFGPSPRT